MRGILIAVVLGLTALAFYSALWFKSEIIERDITDRVTKKLSDTDAKDISIDVDGRHVTLSGIVYDAQAEADHLDTADTTYGALGPIDGLTYLTDSGYISASKTDDGITLRGTVPNEDARARLLTAATDATQGSIDDQLTISGPVADWQEEASFGLGKLAGLTTGTMTVAAGAYALSGVTDSDADSVQNAVTGRDGWQAFVSMPTVANDMSEEVKRLNGEVATRDEQIAVLQGNVADLDATTVGLTQERDALGLELDALRTNLTEEQAAAATLQNTLTATQADLDAANGLITERDAKIADLNGQVTTVTSQVAGAKTLAATLSTTISNNDTQIARLRSEANGLNSRIAELETELANRQVALGSTDEQVIALNASVGELNEGIAARDAKIADLNGIVAARDDTIATLNQTVAESQSQIGTFEAEITTQQETIKTLGETIDGNQRQIAALQANVAERDGTIEELRGAVPASGLETSNLGEDLSSLQEEVAGLNTTLAARDATIASLQNSAPTASNAAQCAAQAASIMEGSQINFRTGTARIDNRSVDQLERLTGIALACVGDDLTVEVGGHTDNQGSDRDNQSLSEARAKAVVAFMTERGVPSDGLKAVGYGETQPVADNKTAQGRAQNRRISFDWQAR